MNLKQLKELPEQCKRCAQKDRTFGLKSCPVYHATAERNRQHGIECAIETNNNCSFFVK